MRIDRLSFLILSAFALFLSTPSLLAAENPTDQSKQEKKEVLTADDLLQTKAAKLFIVRKHAEALEEFKKLAEEYPKDNAIKRYIGACLFYLSRDEEAIRTFEGILGVEPADLAGREYLAKTYLRNGNLDKAEEHFAYIAGHDNTGNFAVFAKSQLDSIKKLREASKASATARPGQLNPPEFLKTKAAQAFLKAEYEEALNEFEALEAQYPQDLLVMRYRALTMDKLAKFEDAINLYNAGLEMDPSNIPLHYFLAQTYVHVRDYEKADKELAFVESGDTSGAYKFRAQADRQAVAQIMAMLRQQQKKWSVNGSAGYEYNTNATSESAVTPSIAEEHANKFPYSLALQYEALKNGPWTGRISYTESDTFYEGTPTLNTISHAVGATLSHVQMFDGKPLITQLGETYTHSTVHRKFYSVGFSQSASIIYSFADWHRITLSYRPTFTDYKSKGSDPIDATSRKGWGHAISVTNNIYLDKEKSRSAQLGYDYGYDDVEGSNNVKDSHAWRTAYHFPFIDAWDGDINFKYKRSDYPHYGPPATAVARFDGEYTLGLSLSKMLNPNWNLSTSYNYTNNNSKDDLYTYTNHAGGLTLSFFY